MTSFDGPDREQGPEPADQQSEPASPWSSPGTDQTYGTGQTYGAGQTYYGPYGSTGYDPDAGAHPGYGYFPHDGQQGYAPWGSGHAANQGYPNQGHAGYADQGYWFGPTAQGQYGPYRAPAAYAPAPAPKRTNRGLLAAIVATVAVVAVIATVLVGGAMRSTTGSGTAGTAIGGTTNNGNGNGTNNGGTNNGGSTTQPTQPTQPSQPTLPNLPGSSNGGSSNSPGTSTGTATAAQQVGIVDIYTVQKYNGAAAAGTGMVLTTSGRILTNNHVISGSTSIRVVVVSTGKSYTATVVGTAPSRDIAVLQVQNASGLQRAKLGNSDSVKVADTVTGVGNAGGVGGTPSSATGKVLALNKTITAADEGGADAEKLSHMIIVNAPIKSGDSGGPLYNSSGQIIGINTAASTSGASRGFAIPINIAVSWARQIERGVETSAIHIGLPGFLAISMTPNTKRPVVYQAISGGAAEKAGIGSGDRIVSVGSTTVTTQTQLRSIISAKEPGSTVSVTYVDPQTGRHTVSVTLDSGPAD